MPLFIVCKIVFLWLVLPKLFIQYADTQFAPLIEEDILRWVDSPEKGSGYFEVERGGASLGILSRRDRKPLSKVQPPNPLKECRHSDGGCGDRFEVQMFTDIVRKERDLRVVADREDAFEVGCWNATYTPDICCANKGWDECWNDFFSYDKCCRGWEVARDADHLAVVQKGLFFAQDMMLQRHESDESTMWYPHPLVLAGMLAEIAIRTARSSGMPQRPLVLAEVGVYQGAFSGLMLRQLERLGVAVGRYYVVDMWGPLEDRTNAMTEARGMNNKEGEIKFGVEAFQETLKELLPYWPVARIIKEMSVEAAQLIRNETLDLAFIDAGHAYQEALLDIEAWWPKVRPGGLLAGHDFAPEKPFRYPGVTLAIQGFAERLGLADHLIGIPGTSFAMKKPL